MYNWVLKKAICEIFAFLELRHRKSQNPFGISITTITISCISTCLCLFIHNNLYRSYVCHRIWLLKFLENRVKWQYSLLCTDYELFEIFKSNKLYKINLLLLIWNEKKEYETLIWLWTLMLRWGWERAGNSFDWKAWIIVFLAAKTQAWICIRRTDINVERKEEQDNYDWTSWKKNGLYGCLRLVSILLDDGKDKTMIRQERQIIIEKEWFVWPGV